MCPLSFIFKLVKLFKEKTTCLNILMTYSWVPPLPTWV